MRKRLTFFVTLSILCHLLHGTTYPWDSHRWNNNYGPFMRRSELNNDRGHGPYPGRSDYYDYDPDLSEEYKDEPEFRFKKPWPPRKPPVAVPSDFHTHPPAFSTPFLPWQTPPNHQMGPWLTTKTPTNPQTKPKPEVNINPAEIRACIVSCPVTPEYNPVCGTDNETYSNIGRFECARRCGKDIAIQKRSTCQANIENNNKPTEASTETNSNIGRVTPGVNNFSECFQRCPRSKENIPICGTDNKTYKNPTHLLCYQFCGIDVRVKKFSSCSSTNSNINTAFWETQDYPDNTCNTGTPMPPAMKICTSFCPMSEDYKPVCGTDNVTYKNLGFLECAKRCGADISVKFMSACPTVSGDKKTTPSPQIIEACIKSCPVTNEFNPVCGTNNVTYSNVAHLDCARTCGISVSVWRWTTCTVAIVENVPTDPTQPPGKPTPMPITVQTCIMNCPTTPEYDPVCGTNGLTYNNIGRLNCAKTCGVDVSVRLSKACPAVNLNHNSDTSTPATNQTPPTVQPSGLTTEILLCMQSCIITPEHNPVCGTNNVTYNNIGRLNCARNCGVRVQMKYPSACTVNSNMDLLSPNKERETTTATTSTASATTINLEDVTISKDILDAIFNGGKFPTDNTTPYPDIDERFS